MKNESCSKESILAIDGLRGIAVFSVVVYHFSWFVHPFETTFMRRGYIGVDLFFLVSGFLASFTTKNIDSGPKASLKYISMRLVRIFPVYYIITTGYLAVYLIMGSSLPSWDSILKSYLFLPAMPLQNSAFSHPVIDVGWTLNYEFFFTYSLQ